MNITHEMGKRLFVSNVDGFLYRIRELTNNLHAINHSSDDRTTLQCTLELLSPLAITPLIATLNESGLPVSYSENSLKLPTPIEFNRADLSSHEDSSLFVTKFRETKREERHSEPLAQLHNSFLNTVKRKIIMEKDFIAFVGEHTLGFILSEILDNVEQH